MHRLNNPSGFSLLETLIALSLANLILLGSTQWYAEINRKTWLQEASMTLENALHNTLNRLSQDIRRAGFYALASENLRSGQANNPFTQPDLAIKTPIPSCLLFAYDLDKTGQLPALNAQPYDKRFGYRLNNSAVETRAFSDPTFSCTQGQWLPIDAYHLFRTRMNRDLSPLPQRGRGDKHQFIRSSIHSFIHCPILAQKSVDWSSPDT